LEEIKCQKGYTTVPKKEEGRIKKRIDVIGANKTNHEINSVNIVGKMALD